MDSTTKIILLALPAPYLDEPTMNPPLGLSYISSYLKVKGFNNVKCVDLALYEDYLKYIPLDGDIYGISILTPQYKWFKEVSKYIRNNVENAIIIAGGPHASSCNIDNKLANKTVKGFGETAMLEILTGEKCYLHSLDDLPMPDREAFGLSNYKRTLNGRKAIHLVTLRGCPYNCSYCDKKTVGQKVMFHSVESVLEEIDYLKNNYDIDAFIIYDDIFTLNKERLLKFCEEFKKRNLIWRCWSRTDTVNKEKLLAMKDSGLQSITFGVESSSDKILKNVNKKATTYDNWNTLLLCNRLNIPVRCSLMYGNPGENLESINDTLSMIYHTQPTEWNLSIFTPIPGSAIWDNPEKFGVHFDKQSIIDNDYVDLNRFGETGIGTKLVTLDSMSDQEYIDNLKYFVTELERICPRKNVQDTLQNILIERI